MKRTRRRTKKRELAFVLVSRVWTAAADSDRTRRDANATKSSRGGSVPADHRDAVTAVPSRASGRVEIEQNIYIYIYIYIYIVKGRVQKE